MGGWQLLTQEHTQATTQQQHCRIICSQSICGFVCLKVCYGFFFFPKINFWLKYSQTDENNTALQCFAYPLFPIIPKWLLQRVGREKTSSLTTVHIQQRKFREVIYVCISKIHVWNHTMLIIYWDLGCSAVLLYRTDVHCVFISFCLISGKKQASKLQLLWG